MSYQAKVELAREQEHSARLRTALQDCLDVIDMLMPGLKHISVPDYQKLNEAPIEARKLLCDGPLSNQLLQEAIMDSGVDTPHDNTLATELAKRGIEATFMWSVPGPKDSQTECLTAYRIQDVTVIVETFKDGNGWDAFLPAPYDDVDRTVQYVIDQTSHQTQI